MKTPNDVEKELRPPQGTPLAGTSSLDFAQARLGTILRGKYRLESVLGMGGMAVVYQATHRNQAEYAIKMLLPQHSLVEEIRSRFLREGYAANSVKHAGTVRVLDDDVTEDGTAFLVLELLHGAVCDKLCTENGGRLPVAAVCSIGLQVLDVLEAAHAKGIIHRDIKPANLFVLRDGTVKVFDFGIARVRETMLSASHATGRDTLLGTPAFMAPEQAAGKSSDVDARSDIWAVGATLFSLLSGATVHQGDTARELLVKLVTQPPRPLRSAAPEVPDAVAQVVDRALTVNREERWHSARAMQTALEEACRTLWGDVPAPAVLANLVAATRTISTAASKDASPRPEPLKRDAEAVDVPTAAIGPTMPAQPQRPDTPAARAVVETSNPVFRERVGKKPRRSLAATLGIFGLLGAASGIASFVVLRSRSTAPEPSVQSSLASGSALASAPRSSSSGPTSPEPGKPEIAVVPLTESSAMLPAASANAWPGPSATLREKPSAKRTPGAKNSLVRAEDAGQPKANSPSAPPVPGAARANCNPPFYYDSALNRVFKKECL
ncbi:MAG TPA: protein kinase [Polyangiaceae bacterium]|nr:protein kinase [Polyangiaceae bacterium]